MSSTTKPAEVIGALRSSSQPPSGGDSWVAVDEARTFSGPDDGGIAWARARVLDQLEVVRNEQVANTQVGWNSVRPASSVKFCALVGELDCVFGDSAAIGGVDVFALLTALLAGTRNFRSARIRRGSIGP
jgi:hypothetical protein